MVVISSSIGGAENEAYFAYPLTVTDGGLTLERGKEAYGLLFRIENVLREFVILTMARTVGPRWWKQRVPADVREKASAGKAVGVVLYAIHKSRARPILSAIRRGIVSHLVTEMGLAVELKRLVEQELPASR